VSIVRVDVVLPLHRGRPFVLEAIESVRAQRMSDWRLWIVEDACPERTLEWVEQHSAGSNGRLASGSSLPDPRIEMFRLEVGRGAAAARNVAAARGHAPWIAFLDQDDRWHPDKLQRQLEELEASDAAAAHTDVVHVDAAGQPIAGADAENRARAALRWNDEPPAALERALFRHNRIRLSSAVVARERFTALGGFDTQCFGGEDWAFWVRLAGAGGRIVHIPEPLHQRRYHGENTSVARRSERRSGHFEALRQITKDHPHLRPLARGRVRQLYRKHITREIRAGESQAARTLARGYLRAHPAEMEAWLLLAASWCTPLVRRLASPRVGGVQS